MRRMNTSVSADSATRRIMPPLCQSPSRAVSLDQFPALPSVEAVALVKKALGTPAVRCSAPTGCPVSRIAVCGGSGTSLIPAARKAGAQMYVCGDVSYHYFFQPEGFMVVDAGHFETEVEITEVLLSVIRKKFPTFVTLISENIGKANPVNYL